MALKNVKIFNQVFPECRFAFYCNPVDRFKFAGTNRVMLHKQDLILAVDDLKSFHQENLELNKKHYTYMNRATKNRVLNYFQNKGAKVHFNTIKIEDTEVIDQTGKLEYLNLRYGVIQYEDLVRDLSYWETMLVSSLMQRPIKTAINSDEIWEHQAKNLRSALAISALDIKNGDKETKLYDNIVNIPHYHNKFMTILDKEDEEKIVQKNYDKFQEMYHSFKF